ncbi:MAG: protein translocase subunit SecF, partial [Myxococcota bacterium]
QIEDAIFGAMSIPKTVTVDGKETRNEIVRRVEFVGPQVGNQLRNQGILAVLYALGFILIYVAIRFDLAFSPGAVVALVHDVIITVGVFAVFQLEFNLPIIAAILALVGYSLNDTIVVYDRIRENAVRYRGRALRDLVNTSLNQTLSRTLITSITTLLATVSLLVFGGGIVRDFAIALTIGVIIGTYSSIAVASPVYIFLRERSKNSSSSGGSSPKSGSESAAA